MNKLHIGEGFYLPLEFVTQTQAILAKKRVGKTYTAKKQAEELLKASQQVVAIDPTGAWWGLKSSADGKHAGFPIAVFGGEHADIPLEETAGETIARALVEQRFSAILDLSLFRKGQIARFMPAFLETLYRLNREAMHLFVDEADAIAPQKPWGEEARMLGAMEDVVRRGGIRGIGTTLITQRPAVINKNVLTQCEILCALRIVHHKDIDAIHEWVQVHGDEQMAKQMIESLPALPTGEAWFWAPGFGDLFERVKIRPLETFDSGATPKAGEAKRTAKVLASVDLEKLGQQITATIERAKENDPKELKHTIEKLRKELVAAERAKMPAPTKAAAIDPKVTARAVQQALAQRDKAWRDAIATRDADYRASLREWQTMMKLVPQLSAVQIPGYDFEDGGRIFSTPAAQSQTLYWSKPPGDSAQGGPSAPPAAVKPNGHSPRPRREATAPPEGFSASHIKVLSRLSELLECVGQDSVRKEQLAAWAEYSPTSGGFKNYLGALHSARLIDYPTPGYVAITDEGRTLAQPGEIPASSDEMLERAKRVLGSSEGRLLEVLHATRETVAKTDLAETVGFSPDSGGFKNYLGHMRTLGFIEYPQKGMVRAADWLYL